MIMDSATKVIRAKEMDISVHDLKDDGTIKEYVPPQFRKKEVNKKTMEDLPKIPYLYYFSAKSYGCPDGHTQGGVCRPFSNPRREDWMSYYNGVRWLKLSDAILPGTHNSGYDKDAPHQDNWNTCQDISPKRQLESGIRVLDIRTQFFSGYAMGDPRRFQIFHASNSGRNIRDDILGYHNVDGRFFPAGVKGFHYSQPFCLGPIFFPGYDRRREIVILDFHEFKNFTIDAYKELGSLIEMVLGESIIEPGLKNLTISEIWNRGSGSASKNVVVASGQSLYSSRFWGGVSQGWSGYDMLDPYDLKKFMDKLAAEKQGSSYLWTIQCHTRTDLFFVPRDISLDIHNWFTPNNPNGYNYIKKFNIINTDWSLRQKLVDFCISANYQKSLDSR